MNLMCPSATLKSEVHPTVSGFQFMLLSGLAHALCGSRSLAFHSVGCRKRYSKYICSSSTFYFYSFNMQLSDIIISCPLAVLNCIPRTPSLHVSRRPVCLRIRGTSEAMVILVSGSVGSQHTGNFLSLTCCLTQLTWAVPICGYAAYPLF